MKSDGAVTKEEIDQAIEAVRKGDAEKFSVVIQAYHIPVRSLIGSQIADCTDADDIAQQTFVFAYQNLDDYKVGTNCLAWLKAIARNKIMAHFRNISRSQKNMQNYRKQLILQRSVELAGGDADRRLEALGKCIEKLPDEPRNFLRQVNSRESTLEEFAREVGRSGAAVRKQVSRLYDRLRCCIAERLKSTEV